MGIFYRPCNLWPNFNKTNPLNLGGYINRRRDHLEPRVPHVFHALQSNHSLEQEFDLHLAQYLSDVQSRYLCAPLKRFQVLHELETHSLNLSAPSPHLELLLPVT